MNVKIFHTIKTNFYSVYKSPCIPTIHYRLYTLSFKYLISHRHAKQATLHHHVKLQNNYLRLIFTKCDKKYFDCAIPHTIYELVHNSS